MFKCFDVSDLAVTKEQMTTRVLFESVLGVQNCILLSGVKPNYDSASNLYSSLIEMVSKAPDAFKSQLNYFVYPVFVHLYLELVIQGDVADASKFYDEFKYLFINAEGYNYALKELANVRSEQEFYSHPYFKLFRGGKYTVRLSDNCLEYFVSYLKDGEHLLLMKVVSSYFMVEIYEDDDEENEVGIGVEVMDNSNDSKHKVKKRKGNTTESDEKKSDTNDQETEENFQNGVIGKPVKQSVFIEEVTEAEEASGTSVMDMDEDPKDESEDKIEEQEDSKVKHDDQLPDGQKDTLVDGDIESKIHASEDSEGTPVVTGDVETEQKEPAEVAMNEEEILNAQKKLQEMEAKMTELTDSTSLIYKNAPCVPSVCCYDIVSQPYRNMNDASISFDCTMLASSFEDSSIELWSLGPKQLHSLPTSVDVSSVWIASDDEPQRKCSLSQMKVLRGHRGAVHGLSFNRESSLLLSCSEDTTIRAWSMNTHKNIVIYVGHNYPVWDIDFNLFSFYFASASMDNTARLWNTERTFPLLMLVGHGSSVDCVKFHPNGNYLATGSRDKSVRMWNTHDAREVRCFFGHTDDVRAIAFSPDGKYLASAGADQVIKIWDLRANKELTELGQHSSLVYSLCFNSNSSILASCGMENRIRLWNIEKCVSPDRTNPGKDILDKFDSRLLLSFETQCSMVRRVTFSRKNLLLAIGVSSTPEDMCLME